LAGNISLAFGPPAPATVLVQRRFRGYRPRVSVVRGL